MRSKSLSLTPAEWAVIKAVWDTQPCTAPQIHEKLLPATGWTYSTVRTMMDRMVAKGILSGRKRGKMTLFKSAVTPAQAQRGELLNALRNVFDDALTPMVQCLLESRQVSTEELADLEALIKAKRKGGK